VVLFDDELSPVQQRHVEEILSQDAGQGAAILDIFARRARIARAGCRSFCQLDYMLPRLSGKGVLLSRLGGGIGTRGPGESKLETDRRRIRQRIQSVKREIEGVRRARLTRREGRRRHDAPVVSLVGYTSAGKSTLFNALTRARAEVSDKLFMTLDPLVRRARFGAGREILLVDTVGFIKKLPHGLVAAFRATLEEVVAADLLLHVMDGSAPDFEEREAAVLGVLEEIGAGGRPRIDVLNKRDLIPEARGEALVGARPEAVLVSATRGTGLPELGRPWERLALARARCACASRSATCGPSPACTARGASFPTRSAVRRPHRRGSRAPAGKIPGPAVGHARLSPPSR
jgi:GTP-binding protein HflX